jgi:hypothetical protein
MSTLSGGPGTVTSGLILNLDAANTKSYVNGSTTWGDISKGGNNGTLINGPTFDSLNGGSIVFDGTNDYGTIPYTFQNQYTNKLSVTVRVQPAWFDIGNSDGVTIINRNMPSLTSPYVLWSTLFTPAGKFTGVISDGVTRVICTSTNSTSLNVWVNLCMVYDTSTIKLYSNSVQDPTTAACNYTIGQNTVPVTIASNQTLGGYYDWFKGNIGIIQIYNRALSAAEVKQNFNATRTRFGV